MAYPILAEKDTWFSPNNSSVKRANITEIEIIDRYTPDASVTVTDSWDASAAKDGSITCYVIGTKLIMAGNGSGKIAANSVASCMFSDSTYKDPFSSVSKIKNTGLLYVGNTTNMMGFFDSCASLTSLDVSNWDVSQVTDMMGCFFGCAKLTSLDVSNWDVSKVLSMSNIFASCKSLTFTDTNVSNWNVSAVTDMSAMFYFCESLTSLDVSNWDVSKVSKMSRMFDSCKSLTYLDVSNWDVSAVTTMKDMFPECNKLSQLDVVSWNPSSCTDMSFMFYQCSSLKEIDVSNWDVSKVTNFDHFAAHANLKRKGIEKWNTSSATNLNAVFHACAEEELDLSGWDVSKNQFFCQMFENSQNLKRIKGLEKWNTSAGLGFDEMFGRCSKLEEVDLSAFNTTKAKNNVKASTNNHKTATLKDMFVSCNNLKKITLGTNFSINGDGTNTTAANKAILPTPSASYISGADGNWYNFTGDSFAPNAMKDKTAETYYASYDMVANADVIVKNGSLIDAAKAIREKNGTSTKYTPAQFGTAIRAL